MESQRSVAAWRYSVFGRAKSPEHVVGRMVMEVGELLEKLGYPIARRILEEFGEHMSREERAEVTFEPDKLAEIRDELADVMVVLLGAADEFGIDLQAALDQKMGVNRARDWRVSGPGLGRHA